ncbi:uncharacterized protein LOC120713552 [Panicum virgatum]|uniref:uncharacterized protein LOC120713552 n=1 Tax=Panicum virgatum TaxID=38727 RepID=UPI0019D58646|nr:uncharacterized protein LOC120713552 [Panicum virgatum]
MIKKNLKVWEDCLPHVEFAYNRAIHSTTQMCPFEVVYGLKLITPLDLLPLPLQECTNMEASKRVEYVKSIHMKTKQDIEKKSKHYAAKANKNRDDYAVSNTFNVADLSPFFGEESESRSTLFDEGEDDEDIPSDEQDNPHDGQDDDVYKGSLTRARAQLLQDEVPRGGHGKSVPVMAPDFATEVQGKNCTNSKGFTMSILYRWKHLEV